MAENYTEYVAKLMLDTADYDRGLVDADKKAQTTAEKIASGMNKAAKAWTEYSKKMASNTVAIDTTKQTKALKEIQSQYQATADAARKTADDMIKSGNRVSKTLKAQEKASRTMAAAMRMSPWQREKFFDPSHLWGDMESQTEAVKDEIGSVVSEIQDGLTPKVDELHDAIKSTTSDTVSDLQTVKDTIQDVNSTPLSLQSQMSDDASNVVADTAEQTNKLKAIWLSFTSSASDAWHRFTAPAGEFSEEADVLREKIASLKLNMAQFDDATIYTDDWIELNNELSNAENAYDALLAKQEKFNADGVEANAYQFKTLQIDIEKAKLKVDDLKQSLAEMQENGEVFKQGQAANTYQDMASELATCETELSKIESTGISMAASLGNKLNDMWVGFTSSASNAWLTFADTASDAWHRFTAPAGEFSEKAGKMREKIASLKDKMEELANEKIYTLDWIELNKELVNTENAYNTLLDKQDKFNAIGVKKNSSQFKSLQYDIEKARLKIDDLKQAIADLRENGNDYKLGSETSGYQEMASELAGYETELSQIESSGASMAAALGSKIGSAIATGAKWGITTFGKIMQTGFKNMGNAVKSVVDKFKSWRRETVSLQSVLKKAHQTFTSFASLLKTRIKRTFISEVFNDMKANMGSMAKQSSEFNSAVSGMTNSCKALGAQILAIAEPLIRALAPAIEKVIDMMTAGADKLAQFTARLTGNSDYFKATKGQYDYAKSLDSTANSASKATKKTKEYQNTVLSFDQLHKLNGNNDDDSVTGISDAQLEKAQTQASAVNSIADKIWDALTKHDFKAAGQGMGEAINSAFDWIKDVAGWDENSDKITKFTQGVIDFVNGLSEAFDGTKVGTAIGDVANSLIESFALLTDPTNGIDFGAIGKNIGDTIVAAVNKIHWGTLGKDIIQGIQAAVRFVNGVISRPGFFSGLGKAFASAIGGIIDNFKPEDWANVLANMINGFGDFLSNAFGDTEKFNEAGNKLADAINQTFQKLDPQKITDGLNSFFHATMSFVEGLLGNLEWGNILSTIGDILLNLDWGSMLGTVAVFAAGKIPSLLSSAFSNPMVTGIALIAGFAITEIIKHWDDIKAWFLNIADKVKTWFDGVGDWFKARWQGIKDFFGGIGDWISEKWNGLLEWFGTTMTNIAGALSEWWGTIEQFVSDAATWLLDTLKAIPNGVIAGVEWMVNKVVDGINWMISQLNALHIDLPDWMGGGVIGFNITPLDEVKLPRLANGGIVGDGQVFIANEGKAELIGGDGGQTAVVNNNQIIDAVTQGVRSAMMDVVMMMQDGNNNNGDDGDIVLYIGDEEVARASLRGQKKINRRTSPTIAFA